LSLPLLGTLLSLDSLRDKRGGKGGKMKRIILRIVDVGGRMRGNVYVLVLLRGVMCVHRAKLLLI